MKKYCQKQLKQEETKAAEDLKPKTEEQKKNDLDKQMEKGAIQLAPSKAEKMAGGVFMNLAGKGKAKKSKKGNAEAQDGQIDFSVIKKFNNLKITVPMKDEEYETTIKALDDLKLALVYWGKIIQKQAVIKFIRGARKISSIEEYKVQAEQEEKYIEQEKAKYQSEDTAQHDLNAEKLKLAQVIDRESRIKKAWDKEDEEEAFVSDEEDKPVKTKAKEAKRPNKQKFSEIMKHTDAFPTLENNFQDDDEYDNISEDPKEETEVKEEKAVEVDQKE